MFTVTREANIPQNDEVLKFLLNLSKKNSAKVTGQQAHKWLQLLTKTVVPMDNVVLNHGSVGFSPEARKTCDDLLTALKAKLRSNESIANGFGLNAWMNAKGFTAAFHQVHDLFYVRFSFVVETQKKIFNNHLDCYFDWNFTPEVVLTIGELEGFFTGLGVLKEKEQATRELLEFEHLRSARNATGTVVLATAAEPAVVQPPIKKRVLDIGLVPASQQLYNVKVPIGRLVDTTKSHLQIAPVATTPKCLSDLVPKPAAGKPKPHFDRFELVKKWIAGNPDWDETFVACKDVSTLQVETPVEVTDETGTWLKYTNHAAFLELAKAQMGGTDIGAYNVLQLLDVLAGCGVSGNNYQAIQHWAVTGEYSVLIEAAVEEFVEEVEEQVPELPSLEEDEWNFTEAERQAADKLMYEQMCEDD